MNLVNGGMALKGKIFGSCYAELEDLSKIVFYKNSIHQLEIFLSFSIVSSNE